MANDDTKKEETAAAAETVEKTVEETKAKEVDPDEGKIILHQFPRAPLCPNMSPYCLKLETFLRVTKLDYRCDFKKWKGPAGKTPYVTIDGKDYPDSQLIIEHLAETVGERANLDRHLSKEQNAVAHGIRIALENHYIKYFAYDRFSKKNRKFLKENFMIIPGVPGFLQGFALSHIGRGVIKSAKAAGITAHDDATILKFGSADLRAVSDYLGGKPYFFGDTITTIDCVIFAFTAQLIWNSAEENDYRKMLVEEMPNLKEHAERMRERYWPDWDEQCYKKPEPAPKKEKEPKKEKKEKAEEKKEEEAKEEKKDEGDEKKDDEK